MKTFLLALIVALPTMSFAGPTDPPSENLSAESKDDGISRARENQPSLPSRPLSSYIPPSVRNRMPDRAIQLLDCDKNYKKIGAYVGIPVFMLGAGYLYYNWGYPDGQWEDHGDKQWPNRIPKVGNEFKVEERFAAISIPRRRTMWVHNGKNSFGRVIVDGDRIKYMRGKEMIATTDVVSPYGRPYEKDKPLITAILDGSEDPIGFVEEVSDEVSPDVVSVQFRVLDKDKNVIGVTDTFSETLESKPVNMKKWGLSLKDGDDGELGNVARTGSYAKTYHWKLSTAERSVDPRLLVILSAYKSYVESYRK